MATGQNSERGTYTYSLKDSPLERAWAKRHNAPQRMTADIPVTHEDVLYETGQWRGDFDDMMDYQDEKAKRVDRAVKYHSYPIWEIEVPKGEVDSLPHVGPYRMLNDLKPIPAIYEHSLIEQYFTFAGWGAEANYRKFRGLLIEAGYTEQEVDSVELKPPPTFKEEPGDSF